MSLKRSFSVRLGTRRRTLMRCPAFFFETAGVFRDPGRAGAGLDRFQLALHRMQRPNQHDAHVTKVAAAIAERPQPVRFVSRQTFPHLGLMIRSNASSQQKISDCFRHEIPWTRNDNRVPIVLERMHEMLLERHNVAAPMKSNERRLIEANAAT